MRCAKITRATCKIVLRTDLSKHAKAARHKNNMGERNEELFIDGQHFNRRNSRKYIHFCMFKFIVFLLDPFVMVIRQNKYFR